MSHVDFLPAEYRQRRVQRRQMVWRNAVTAGLCVAVALVAIVQSYLYRSLLGELAALESPYEQAHRQTEQLNQLQAELKTAQADAELFAYLEHPWPRTQIVAQLLEPLPEEIAFRSVRIGKPSNALEGRNTALLAERREEKRPEALREPPAVEDLRRLREEQDRTPTVVTLEGTTSDSNALHRYLGQLNGGGLFRQAELETLDETPDHKGLMQFRATVQVRPGYGLPGGPSGPPAADLARHESQP